VPKTGKGARGQKVPQRGQAAKGVLRTGKAAKGVPKTGKAAKGVPKTGKRAKGVPKTGKNKRGAQAAAHVVTLRIAINHMSKTVRENYTGCRTGGSVNGTTHVPSNRTCDGFIVWCRGNKKRCASVWNHLNLSPKHHSNVNPPWALL